MSKSEAAFEAWYAKQKEPPMPSDCWDACMEFVLKYVNENAHRPAKSSITQWEPFVYVRNIEELTK